MIIRKINTNEKDLYLTFDDGPHPNYTPQVLEILKNENIPATFFLVANKALVQKQITDLILAQGHAVGNHSLDHHYRVFFQGKTRMKNWILKAEKIFQNMGIQNTVGFRPPSGIITPELYFALKELKIPLILWNKRFFDTIFLWDKKKADIALERLSNGSIILLHDVQKDKNFDIFLETLLYFIKNAKSKGFQFKKLQNPTESRAQVHFESPLRNQTT